MEGNNETTESDFERRIRILRESQTKRKNQISRVEGRRSQDRAKRALGIPDNTLGKDSDEEFWGTDKVRFEVKSGKQVSNTYKMFENAETQSFEFEVTKPTNEQRDLFSMVMMPHGSGDGIFLCRISQLKEIVVELQHIWQEGEENGLDKE